MQIAKFSENCKNKHKQKYLSTSSVWKLCTLLRSTFRRSVDFEWLFSLHTTQSSLKTQHGKTGTCIHNSSVRHLDQGFKNKNPFLHSLQLLTIHFLVKARCFLSAHLSERAARPVLFEMRIFWDVGELNGWVCIAKDPAFRPRIRLADDATDTTSHQPHFVLGLFDVTASGSFRALGVDFYWRNQAWFQRVHPVKEG